MDHRHGRGGRRGKLDAAVRPAGVGDPAGGRGRSRGPRRIERATGLGIRPRGVVGPEVIGARAVAAAWTAATGDIIERDRPILLNELDALVEVPGRRARAARGADDVPLIAGLARDFQRRDRARRSANPRRDRRATWFSAGHFDLWIVDGADRVHGRSSRRRRRAARRTRLHTARASQPRLRTAAHLRGDRPRAASDRTSITPCSSQMQPTLSRTRSTGRPDTSPAANTSDRARSSSLERNRAPRRREGRTRVGAMNLDGKVAVVTGSGRGIGRAYALALAQAGCAVVVNDVDADVAEATADEISAPAAGSSRRCARSDPRRPRTSSSPAPSRRSGISTSCAPTPASFATACSGT